MVFVKRKMIIVLCFILLLIFTICILTCKTVHEYSFSNNKELNEKIYLSLWKGYPEYNFRVYEYLEMEHKIENIEFIQGFANIGKYNIVLLDELTIGVFINKYKFFSNENNGLLNYTLYFNGMIDENIIIKIFNEYNKQNIESKVYLKYIIYSNDKVIINEINKTLDINIRIKKHRYNIFNILLWKIILGGDH